MSDLNTAASLNLEIETGSALATLVAINAELDKLALARSVDASSITNFAKRLEDLEGSSLKSSQYVTRLEDNVTALKSALAASQAEADIYRQKLSGVGKAAETTAAKMQGVDKTLRSIQLTSNEAGRVMGQGFASASKQFESISNAARATSSNVKSAVAALTVDLSGQTGMRDYYETLTRVSTLVERVADSEAKSHGALSQARQQAVAAITRENTELQKLNAHYAGLEAQERARAKNFANNLELRSVAAEEVAEAKAAEKAIADLARAKNLANNLELRVIAAEEAGKVREAAKAAADLARAKNLANNLELRVIRQEEVAKAKELNRQLALTSRYVEMSERNQIRVQLRARRLLDRGMDPSGKYAQDAIDAARAAGSVDALEGRLLALSGASDKAGGAIAKAARNTGQFTDAQWQAHAAARGLAGSLGQLWMTYGALVPLLTGAAIGSALRSMVKTGAEVEYQLKVISAVGEGAKVSMGELADATRGSVFSFGEATDALRVLVQAGMSSNDALQTLPQVLKLATVGEVELGKGALTVAAMLETFNLSVGEAGRVTNSMAAAAASSPTSVSAMMEAMKQASTVSAQYNVSIEETSAALAVLAQRGIEGTAAGTAFRNLVKEMAAPATRQAAKAFEDMGVSMFDANGNIRPLVDNLQQLADVASLMSEEDRIKWFESFTNERAAKALSAIVGDMQGYRKALQEVTLAQQGLGFVTEANAELMTSVSGQWKQLGADIGRVFADVYTQLQPALLDFTLALRDVVATEEFKAALEGLARGLLNLTEFVVESGEAIGKFFAILAGYSVVKIVASSLTSLGRAVAGLTAISGIATAFASAKTAFIAANVGASGLAASIGSLGILLANPIAAGIAATVVGLGGLAWYLSESKEKSSDAALAAKDLANKTEILADSAVRGRDEIYKENDALEEHIRKLRSAAGATRDFVNERKFRALEESKEQANALIQTIQSKREAFSAKWDRPLQDGESRSDFLSEYQKEQAEIEGLWTQYKRLSESVTTATRAYEEAKAGSDRNRALATEAKSLELVNRLNEKRSALIEAGAKAEVALSSGRKFSDTYAEVLKQQVEAGKKAREAITLDPSTFDANNKEMVASLHQLQDQLGQITIKPPKIEPAKRPDFSAIDAMRAGLKDAQQTIRDLDSQYQVFVTSLQAANREGEVSSVDMFNAMEAAAANFAEMKKRVAREAAQDSGMNKSAVQDMLNAERQAQNEYEKAVAGIDLARVKNVEQSLRAVEKAEVESGKKRLDELDQFNLQWEAKYGDVANTLAAALNDAAAKGLPEAERLREALNRLFDAKAAGQWAVGIKQAIAEASDQFDVFTQQLGRLGEKSEREGLFGFLSGNSLNFSMVNAQRIAALRKSLRDIQTQLDRQPDAKLKARLIFEKQSLEEELFAAEEVVDPTLERWGDTFGDIVANGIVYGFDKGESPAKQFANMLKKELVSSISAALSKQFSIQINAMLNGMMGGQSGAQAQSVAGGQTAGGMNWLSTAQSAYGLYNNATLAYQWATGSMSAANAAGTMYANTTGGGLDALLSTNGAYGTAAAGQAGASAGQATAQSWGQTAGQAAGAAFTAYNTYNAIQAKQWGRAAGNAIGYYFGGPIGAFIGGEIGGWVDKVASGGAGTPHSGAVVFGGPNGDMQPRTWEEVQAQYADPADAGNFGQKDFFKRRNQGMADALQPIASGMSDLINETLKSFDVFSSYKVGLGFSSDRTDKSRGVFSLVDSSGDEVTDFYRRYSKKAEEGIPELTNDAAAVIRDLFVKELPDWADNMLMALGDKPSIDALEQMVARIKEFQEVAKAVGPALGLVVDDFMAITQRVGGDALNAYVNAFYSDTEKVKLSTEQLGNAFKDLDLALPDSKEGFRALVESLDTSSEAGRDTYATLIALAPAFAAVADAAREASASLFESIDAQIQMRESELESAFSARSSEIEDLITKFERFGESLREFKSKLLLGNLSPLNPQQQYEEAKARFTDVSRRAQLGDVSAIEQLQSVSQDFLESSRGMFASGDAYNADFNSVMAAIDNTETVAERQIRLQQEALDELRTSVGELINIDAGVGNLADAVALAVIELKAVLNRPLNPETGVTTQQITDIYQQELGRAPDQAGLDYWQSEAARGFSLDKIRESIATSPEAQIRDLYETLLRREADEAGVRYWMGQFANGMTIEQIRASFMASDEYQKMPKFAVGTNYVPDDMVAMIHKGERIIPAADNRELMLAIQGGKRDDNSELVAELRQLRAEVAQLRGEQRQQHRESVASNYDANERNANQIAETWRRSARQDQAARKYA